MATKNQVQGSPAFSLNAADWQKLGKSLLLGSAGAVVTYLISSVGHVDFGNYTVIAVPAITWGLNFLRKFIPAT